MIFVPNDLSDDSEFSSSLDAEIFAYYPGTKIYDVDEFTNGIGEAVFYKDKIKYNTSGLDYGYLAIVENVSYISMNDETYVSLTMFYNGKKQIFTFQNDEPIYDPNHSKLVYPSDLNKGDALRVVKGANSSLAMGTWMYDMSKPEGSRFIGTASTNISGDNFYNHGKVKHCDGKYMIVVCDNGTELVNSLAQANIYVYDPDSRNGNKVRLGTLADIAPNAEILFSKSQLTYEEIVVYKKQEGN